MSENSVDFFIKMGVLTGSRAFGVENKDSDYDIAITSEDFQNVMQNLKPSSIIDGENSGRPENRLKNRWSSKFVLDGGETINLIAYDTKEALKVIKRINQKMNKLSIAVLGPKEDRHEAFENLIDKYMTNEVLGIPEININEDEIPFDLHSYCDINSF